MAGQFHFPWNMRRWEREGWVFTWIDFGSSEQRKRHVKPHPDRLGPEVYQTHPKPPLFSGISSFDFSILLRNVRLGKKDGFSCCDLWYNVGMKRG
ncbi:hypothetical protein HMPREF9374_3404 [Desmospora sp. 8437]|nr:hypothetical protein HMPREF9374_3404 [Desmospora sp. 8437]